MATNFKSIGFALLAIGGGSFLTSQTAEAATNQAVHTQAQQAGLCKGIVKDSAGEPLIGASVVVKGTKMGTVTGLDGDFALNKVNKGDVLVITMVR